MHNPPMSHRGSSPKKRRRLRRGATLTEFLVAFGLMSTLFMCVVPTVAQSGRLWNSLRRDRIAMDELSNQLERLSQFPIDALAGELDSIQPSAVATESLDEVSLGGEMSKSEGGYRLQLQISWRGRPTPLRLTTWIYAPSSPES